MKSIIVTNRCTGDITRREDFCPGKLNSFGKLDYVFVPFWSWYIPPEIYQNWEVVIFHITDVPFGRGGSPLQNLIVRGHNTTMISAIECIKELDAGPVFMKLAFDISRGTADEIYDRANRFIREYMIPFIIAEKPIPVPQTGTATIFKRWDKIEIARALDTDYEDISHRGPSR